MKAKNLIVMMLIGVLSVGMFVGCDDGSGGGGDGGTTPAAKVVEAKYRGIWVMDSNPNLRIVITETEMWDEIYSFGTWGVINGDIDEVYSSGSTLYYNYTAGSDIIPIFTFTTDTTFTLSGEQYTKQQ
jgi:hypothetical protein